MLTLDQLIQKYNTNGPRYTSYPPAPFWNQSLDQEAWHNHLTVQTSEKEIEVYVHVPFCEKLCFYCGCNRSITKDHEYEMEFVQLILKEWEFIKKSFSHQTAIRSIHFGGGTPTFLSGKSLTYLLEAFKNELSRDFLGSIEIDPRTLRQDHLEFFKKYKFKRASLGIQDFDFHVQDAINRIQPFELVEQVVQQLRGAGVESINFDVIYGLPRQSVESIESTFEKVIWLNPDMISFFSYAHLPDKIKNQKLINENDLPSLHVKKNIYERGKSILTKNQYIEIGMDHFSLASGYLWKAKEEGRLQRNFMGYTERTTSVLIGLGPSAISDSGLSFKQNHRDFLLYKESILKFNFSQESHHLQSLEDLLVQNCIKKIMCDHTIDTKEVILLADHAAIVKKLENFISDGILLKKDEILTFTNQGKFFLRNVAMVFDRYLNLNRQDLNTQSKASFSQTI